MQTDLKIGTRGSPLALYQAEEVRDRLVATGAVSGKIEIMVIKTSGDAIQDRALRDAGGKELFTKEIEQAILDGIVDIGVHSAKDMATELPPSLIMAAYLPREDVRDAFLSPNAASIADLPLGARIGTASLRRQAQVLALRPDLEVVLFRGNVQTRMRKLKAGEADATLLALAGLKRLGLEEIVSSIIPVEEMLPAVGQGAICIEALENSLAAAIAGSLNDADTADCVIAERAFLAALDGSCRTPIAALATMEAGELHLNCEVLSPDGKISHRRSGVCVRSDGAELGYGLGKELRDMLPSDFFEDIPAPE
ncbi:MAG: hydroxymethylbilane synthase [Rhizobiales bacterium]|nr:hydroxymethylbilane synthase [Hyphomicrobiales bacterium]